jgi:hypothetical protein
MAVANVTTITVKPDRYQDWLEVARKARTLIEKYGGKNIRVLAGLVAGQATGSLVYISEADDFAAAGGVLHKILPDPVGREVMSTGSASPTAGYQTTFWVDVPL